MALPFAGVEVSIVMPGSLRCTASGLSLFVEAVSGLVEIPTSPLSRLLCDETVGRLRPFFEQAISFNDAKGIVADRKVTLEYNGSCSALEQ